jgi:hypothetical protein
MLEESTGRVSVEEKSTIDDSDGGVVYTARYELGPYRVSVYERLVALVARWWLVSGEVERLAEIAAWVSESLARCSCSVLKRGRATIRVDAFPPGLKFPRQICQIS